MRTVYQKVQLVERVFRELDKELAAFAAKSGLACLSGCGKCCHKADIEALPIEFLPFAYHCYKQGKALAWYERLEKEGDNAFCVILHRFKPDEARGWCADYAYRGLICRLFGYAAMRDKLGQPKLMACKPMKEETPEIVSSANEVIAQGAKVPMARDYYFRLSHIDPNLAEPTTINQAIAKALAYVLSYYSYRRGPQQKAG